MNTKEMEEKFSLNLYSKRDLVLVRGKDSKLYDDKGDEYIDCTAQVGVASIGYSNKQVNSAINEQSNKLINCYSIFYNDIRAKLSKRLAELIPGKNKIFLCNSGSEAIEAAIKFARASTGKTDIISAMKGYHGKTLGALSATWDRKYKKIFSPLMPGFKHVPYNNSEALEKEIDENTAAIILEPIQGESGINLGDKEYFQKVRKLCNENNIILIIDEIQTGLCRTGKLFAFQHFDIEPDIICLAKAIAGGIPMGSVICNEKINVPIKSHTTTFGGNPLACAASLATLDFMQKNNLDERAKELGDYFLNKLRKIKSDKIREIRGRGLMIGIELKEKAAKYAQQLQEEGVLVLLAGSIVLRFLPPLIITKEEIDFVVEKVKKVLE